MGKGRNGDRRDAGAGLCRNRPAGRSARPQLPARLFLFRHDEARRGAALARTLPQERHAEIGSAVNELVRLRSFRVLTTLLLLAPAMPAAAQPWSTKSITVVVPFPPGPALDLAARLIGQRLGEELSVPAVVENRTGANGTLGSSAV